MHGGQKYSLTKKLAESFAVETSMYLKATSSTNTTSRAKTCRTLEQTVLKLGHNPAEMPWMVGVSASQNAIQAV